MEFVCFVLISEQTANFALRNIKILVFITWAESVYCAVRTKCLSRGTHKVITARYAQSFYDTYTFRL